MGRKHYQTVDLPRRKPHVGRRLFGVNLQIIHFKFQFFKQKNISFPKFPKIYTKPPNSRLDFRRSLISRTATGNRVVNEKSRGIWHYLKRDRDTGVR